MRCSGIVVLLLSSLACSTAHDTCALQDATSEMQQFHLMHAELGLQGTGNQEALRAHAQKFFASSSARSAFFKMTEVGPKAELPGLISLAGLSRDKEALAFLVRQAIQPIPLAVGGSSGPYAAHDLISETEEILRNGMIAAAAIVAIKALGGDPIVEDETVLIEADAAIVRATAVELYSRGLLTERHRQLLDARRMFHGFRKHTDAERTALFTVSPGVRSELNIPRDPTGMVPPAPVASGSLLNQGLSNDPPTLLSCGDCSERVPAPDLHDWFYSTQVGMCNQVLIDDVWRRFHMNEADWQAFGYLSPCDTRLPLARTVNALGLLNYAGTDTPDCNFENSNVLLWASCWSSNAITYLRPVCDPSPSSFVASTTWWPELDADSRTDLHKLFWYGTHVPWRASVVFHEARHADGWCVHTDSCRAGPGACDPEFKAGCVGFLASGGSGAYGYSVIYDAWFAGAAQPRVTNATLKALAVADANTRLAINFEKDPCFLLDSNGLSFHTCLESAP